MRHSIIQANGLTLHTVDCGEGPAVIFCHGFPDVWRSWRLQMEAVAASGHHAIALDMRGYGSTSAPAEASRYTTPYLVGDVVAVLDHFEISRAVVVGHDFGASVAWNAALMRADRFTGVFCLSVPYIARGETSFLEDLRAAGRDTFYMFKQMLPEADARWAHAEVTYPSVLYWTSASAPPEDRWSPFDERDMYRPAPVPAPSWFDAEDLAYAIGEFTRTGFHGGLNYYRALQESFELAAPYRGVPIVQPAFFVIGGTDGLNELRRMTAEVVRKDVPNLRGFLRLEEVGHWPQREAPDRVNAALLDFLKAIL